MLKWRLSHFRGALLSSCPLEEGVLSTPTAGAISLARVLGGICAGLQPLEISLLELIKYSEETNLGNNIQYLFIISSLS